MKNQPMKTYRCSVAVVLLLAFATSAQSPKPAAPPATAATLAARVKAEAANFKGNIFLYAKNLDTGATYSFNGDEKVRTASTIKTAIMVEAFARVAEGKAKWSDELSLTAAKKVSGSGILQELSDGLKLSFRDGVTLMMLLSDNTATNLVLDILTTDAVNARLDALGLQHTRALRKIGGGGESVADKEADNKKYGLGVTTPHEMVMLMEKLERGEVISREASKEMLDLMKREQGRNGIGRTLNGVEMATKSGALEALRSNVGIIYSQRGRIAMAITCDNMPEVDWTADNAGYYMLSRLSLLLLEGLGK
ncbi:MAG: serine hydrolase [Acidobacteria bacterium]|nr:serine hydrolase [Acidobacteriota bacterium]